MRSEAEIRKALEYLYDVNGKNFRHDKKTGNLIYIDVDGNRVADQYDIDSLTPPGSILANVLRTIDTLEWVLGESTARPDNFDTFMAGIEGYW